MTTLEEIIMAALGHNIKELRKAHGLTQEALSERLEIHRVSLARIERGTRMPDWAFVCKLAEVFGISTDELRKPMKKSRIPA